MSNIDIVKEEIRKSFIEMSKEDNKPLEKPDIYDLIGETESDMINSGEVFNYK